MIRYGKTAQNAIAAMSRLAEVYAEGRRLSSGDIAQRRGLPQTLVAKLLTTLSQAGLVTGAPGPNGGYALARPPEQINLLDVVATFERTDDAMACPFGPTWCGNNDPCPLHDKLLALSEHVEAVLRGTTFHEFALHPQPEPAKATGAKRGKRRAATARRP